MTWFGDRKDIRPAESSYNNSQNTFGDRPNLEQQWQSTVKQKPKRSCISLCLSSRMVVDQCTRPQVHARLHSLVTPPRVRQSSFQSVSRCSPRSLVEDGHVLLCHELAGIAHSYWHVENVRFRACGQESTFCQSCIVCMSSFLE